MEAAYLAVFFGGLIVFFGLHYYTTFRRRDGAGLADRMHRGAYMGLYSLLSIAGFVAMIWGYAMLKPGWYPLGAPPSWGRHVTMALMLPAMILIVAAYMRPVGFIKKAVKHPMLAAHKTLGARPPLRQLGPRLGHPVRRLPHLWRRGSDRAQAPGR